MNQKLRRGLRVRLVGVLALALSPLLVLSAIQSFFELQDERRQETDRLYSAALIASQDIEAALERAAGVASAIATRSFAFQVDTQACANALARIAETDAMISNISVIGVSGRPICSALPAPSDADASGRAFFSRLAAGEAATYSDVYYGPISERPIIVAGRRVEAVDGAFAGAVAVSVDLRAATGTLRRDTLPRDAVLAIIDAGGVTRLASHSATDAPEPAFDRAFVADVLRVGAPGEPTRISEDAFAPGYAVIAAPLIDNELGMLVAAPINAINAWGGLSVLGTLLIPTIMWLMALASVWIAVDLFVLRWLTYLRRMARLYGGGRFDLPARRAQTAPYEVRELADTMERMAASLDAQTKELEDVVEQRGALLREIHHRVKNNLQIIMSLLNLQAGRLEDSGARAALYEARRRINALAMVHRSLYEAEDLRFVEMRPFLQELVRNLADVSQADNQSISAEVRCDALSLPPDKAAPLALFITEAVTNAYKHAFAGRAAGCIVVALTCGSGRCRVAVIDDGVGATEAASAGTGSSLMRAFATQLGGEVESGAAEDGGHQTVLAFPL